VQAKLKGTTFHLCCNNWMCL